MSTKLTLTIEQSVILKAKQYARQKGRSLSDIIENYLKVITSDESKTKVGNAPVTKSLRGSFKAPTEFDYKKNLAKGLTEKYL